MYFRRDQQQWSARAPAKLNLCLEILGRRSDGFHELETLMVPISLADSLTLTALEPGREGKCGEIRLDVRSVLPARSSYPLESIPLGSDNLIVRALERLRELSGCRQGAQINLVKRIPAAAGLGGASSDAAAALRLANRAWELHWSRSRLTEVAADVGSDVPFFLAGCSAICRGRGERVEAIAPLPRMDFVVVKPPVGLPTVDVYQAHVALSRSSGQTGGSPAKELAAALVSHHWQEAAAWMHNRLQTAAATLSPWVDRLRTAFDRLDCIGHQLSGSGSAYFGLCRSRQHARRVCGWLQAKRLGLVYAVRSHS